MAIRPYAVGWVERSETQHSVHRSVGLRYRDSVNNSDTVNLIV